MDAIFKPQQTLYIKNSKGRYEEYKPQKPYDSDVYRRDRNGKYHAIGTFGVEFETEGIWVVCKHRGSRGTTNGDYLVSLFGADKISDLAPIVTNYAELGTIHKVCEEVISEFRSNHNYEKYSMYERFEMLVMNVLKKLHKDATKS